MILVLIVYLIGCLIFTIACLLAKKVRSARNDSDELLLIFLWPVVLLLTVFRLIKPKK